MVNARADAPCRAVRETALGPVRGWLFLLAALVLVTLGVGGATRLTGSGLSITQWQPVVGIIPPLSQEEWQQAFDQYRQIPQYHYLNRGMSLAAFQVIYWWEWAHRLLGRLLGVAFFAPLLYFLATRRIDRRLSAKLLGLLLLVGVQGVAGWYMVRSGLAGRTDVSQYRLALHLGLAMAIFAGLIATALTLEAPRQRAGRRGHASAAVIIALIFLQVVLGGLVAGLKAGLSHNTWPLMDGRFIPVGLGIMQPWYLNLFENAMTVQFAHRLLAYLVLALVVWQAWRVTRSAPEPPIIKSALGLLGAAVLQAGLGIWTLLAHVPVALALAHQAGAAALLAIAVWHFQLLRRAG